MIDYNTLIIEETIAKGTNNAASNSSYVAKHVVTFHLYYYA